MSFSNLIGGEQSSSFSITSAFIRSSRTKISLDVSSILSEMTVYEHMNKSYVTGYVNIVDTDRVLEKIDIQGAETFEITIVRNTNIKNVKPIKMSFVIREITNIQKTSETAQVVTLALIDLNTFQSRLKNVNRSYKGQPYEIISKILEDHLNREDLLTSAEDRTMDTMQVIVPHMTPLQACEWIRNRSININGYPFYFYKTALTDQYIFSDLETLLSTPVMNIDHPYTDNQASGNSNNQSRNFLIENIEQKEIDNLFEMIKEGMVGSRQHYYDITAGDYEPVEFNINNDAIVDLVKLNRIQNRATIDGFLKYDDVEISNYVSKEHYHINAARPYEYVKAYDEVEIKGDNKKKVKSKAIQYLLNKTPLKIAVDGAPFINGNENTGIGNNIRILIKAKSETDIKKLDSKRSGDYLIVAANYTFKFGGSNQVDASLLCAKVANYSTDTYPA